MVRVTPTGVVTHGESHHRDSRGISVKFQDPEVDTVAKFTEILE